MASPSDAVAAISSQLMVAAVIFLVLVVLFIFVLYFFAKYYSGSSSSLFTFTSPRNQQQQQLPISNHGLSPELLASLPITVFNPSKFKEGLQCSVCLDQLSEGEELHELPKCSHGFHVNCIVVWFQSHTTCPLCRAAVITEEVVEPEEVCTSGGVSTELTEIPTNVLFWGNEDGVASQVVLISDEEGSCSSSSSLSPKGMLVIDIPRRGTVETEDMRPPIEEMKTPRSGRLRSFRRLLSRGKMVVDVEEAVGVVTNPY